MNLLIKRTVHLGHICLTSFKRPSYLFTLISKIIPSITPTQGEFMKNALIICGLFLLSIQNVSAADLAKKQERTETTLTCQELEGAGSWSVVILEDQSLNKFWAQVKYELVEYECDDVTDGARVGIKCNQTGGAITVASPKIGFDNCKITKGNNVLCKNKDFNKSSIQVKSNKMKFNLDMNGENGVQLSDFFSSVTSRSDDQSREVGLSGCTVKSESVLKL